MWREEWQDPPGFKDKASKNQSRGERRAEREKQKELQKEKNAKDEREKQERWPRNYGREILKVSLRMLPIRLFEKGFV